MNKKIAALTLTCCLAAPLSQADTLLGLYAGAQAWRMDSSGALSDSATLLTEFNFSQETQGSYYLAFEHPIPLIPNAKIIHSEMDTQGGVTLVGDFSFAGETFRSGTSVNTDVELVNTDYVLYYELFDNDLIAFDLGLNGKYIDGSLLVTDKQTASMRNFSGIVPMLYSRVEVGLPFTGLGAYVEGSYLSFNHTLYDYQAAITYTFIDSLAVDMTAQFGYRSVSLELDGLDSIHSDINFDGLFAGLEVHF